ncbi:MAG TPA: nucleotide pyrophosphohydrolase, partial [Burkholderiales bacterium]|nr:nucleotide pyrophosphohydrolase [Burkholderiales bacterium]
MDVKALQARLAAFAVERGWDEMHNPRNLAIALAGEAGMLLDLFRWLTDAQSQRIESEYKREAAEEAIADLLLHTLRLADKLDIDVERAVAKKLAENDANYPPPVAETVPRAERPAAAPPVVSAPEPPPAAAQVPLPAKKEISAPVEQKRATPAAESAPTPAAKEPKPAVEPPKPSPDKALPSWLDGIMPARSATTRKKLSPAAKPPAAPPKVPESPRAPKPPSPPLAARAVGEIEATSPPVAA